MTNLKDHTILIVDDEEELRRPLISAFKRAGFEVLEAENGRDAFKIVQERKIDVVLSDLQMPNGDGIKLLENTKAYSPILPVFILITGFSEISLDDAYDKGAEAVFFKPFSRKALIEGVLRIAKSAADRLIDRRSIRTEATSDIKINLTDSPSSLRGQVINIGRGGFFVSWEEDGVLPAIGSRLAFQVDFDEGKPAIVRGQGIVRWIRSAAENGLPRGCGVEFEFADAQAAAAAVHFVNRVRTRVYIPKG